MLLFETLKNEKSDFLIFWLVTHDSARDYTVHGFMPNLFKKTFVHHLMLNSTAVLRYNHWNVFKDSYPQYLLAELSTNI